MVVSSGNDLGLQVEYNGSDSDESSSNDGHDQDGQGGGFGSMSSTRARDQGSSNAPVVSVALQTSPVDFLPLSEIELERALSTAAAPLRDSDSRVDSLAAFLLKVESLMDEALDEALTDSVFAAYARASSRDEVDAIELDKELVAAEFVALGVSAVAFSATGSMVAVGYGSSGHSAWCEHEAAIGVWAFNRSRSKSEVPEVLVRTRACVRALAFHPHAAGKLAYATFSGQVSVVDALAAGSGGNVGGGASDSSSGAVVATGVHTEPVVALEWLVVGSRSKAQSGGGHLVSLCAGGRLLMWDAASLSKTAVLGFTLHTSRLGSQLCPLGGSALALAADGANIVVNAVQDTEAAETVAEEIASAGGEAIVHMADVTDRKAVKKMIDAAIGAFSSVDILVCNASARSQKPFTEMTYEEWRRVIDISLDGSFFLAQSAVLHMIEKGWGRIVTLGGISWHIGTPGRVHNLVAKSGLVGFTRGLAGELAQHNITVNCVSPGFINTERPASAGKRPPLKVNPPVARMGETDEIASMIRYLCQPEAAYITGQTLHVNGGMYLGG